MARPVIAADPAAAERRRARAVRERTVAFYPGVDGMASIYLRAPAAQALAAYRRVCDLAGSVRTPGGERTAGARRADTLIDLILNSLDVLHLPDRPDPASGPDRHHRCSSGGCGTDSGGGGGCGCGPGDASPSGASPGDPANNDGSGSIGGGGAAGGCTASAPGRSRPRWAAGPATVHVTVPWTTLAGVDDLPGQLAGYGPITAAYARELAADATRRRILTDPASGTVLDVGTTTYRPPAGLAAHVRARDR